MITEKKWIHDISRQRESHVSLSSYLAYTDPEGSTCSQWRTWKIAECWKPAGLPWGHCHEEQSEHMAEITGRQPHLRAGWRMWLRVRRSERQAGGEVGPRQQGGEKPWAYMGCDHSCYIVGGWWWGEGWNCETLRIGTALTHKILFFYSLILFFVFFFFWSRVNL